MNTQELDTWTAKYGVTVAPEQKVQVLAMINQIVDNVHSNAVKIGVKREAERAERARLDYYYGM